MNEPVTHELRVAGLDGEFEVVTIGPTRAERRAGQSRFRSGNRADLTGRAMRRVRKAERTRERVAA